MDETSRSLQFQKLKALRQSDAISDSEFQLLQAALHTGALGQERNHSSATKPKPPLQHPPAFLIILGTALLFQLYLGVSIKPNATIAQTEAVGPQPEQVYSRVYLIGQPLQRKSIELTVNSVVTRQVIGNIFLRHKAPEGAILVAVTYSVKNTSKEPLSAFSRPRLQLMDPKGVRYDEDLGASWALAVAIDSEAKALSNLNPGIVYRESAAFEVSAADFDRSTWTLILDGDKNMPIKLN